MMKNFCLKIILISLLLTAISAPFVFSEEAATSPPVQQEAQQQEPAVNIPSPSELAASNDVSDMYLIHVGDKLNVYVYEEKELSGIFLVNSSGSINYPLLGEIKADGLSLQQLKEFLTENLGKNYIVNPQVEVSFTESSSKSVSILGQVIKPGSYVMTPDLTISKLIPMVGGFTPNAATSSLRISRGGKEGRREFVQVDADGILQGKTEDVKLLPGDMVFVDLKGSEQPGPLGPDITGHYVTVLGQVARQGNFAIDDTSTLIRLVGKIGGFTPLAASDRVRVVRELPNAVKKVFYVNADKIIAGKAEDVKLEIGDIITVPEVFF